MILKTLSLVALATALVDACVLEEATHEFNPALLTRRSRTPQRPHLSKHERVMVDSFSSTTVDDWSYYYTHGLHIAGMNRTQAQWTADKWAEFGVPSSVVSYHTYLNFPVSQEVSLTAKDGKTKKINLDEEVLEEDSTTSYPNRPPTFHGYSASGDVSAEYVYVGRGQQVDFERLIALGVDLKGKIAISRYGGPFRGLKVKNAQDHGMIGCLIFTDPGDDGNVTVANGYKAYPHGPARNPTSVQRGSVMFLSTYPGDPTTPGYPSREDSFRHNTSAVTPQIPSIPISQEAALPILAALDGHGTPGSKVNRTLWVGGLNVTYSTGPAPGVKINMKNLMRDDITPIWNTVGIINGTDPDEVIILGNHRDAWIVGGASDPNSGSAVMVEIAKAFGKLQKTGWKPKRTIVMCSWDGEEYGLVGSTEWVEEYLPWLKGAAVAYINVDGAVSGPNPSLSATPQLHKLGIDMMKKIMWPIKGKHTNTMYEVWNQISKGNVGVLGSGSDYTAFVHNGIASLNTGSGRGPNDPVYHYHSNYDSYHWMDKFADPGWHTHTAMGQYLGLVMYHLASDEVIPFQVTNYVTQMEKYYDDLAKYVAASTMKDLDITPIKDAICVFDAAAKKAAKLEKQAQHGGHKRKKIVEHLNSIYRDFERGFVSQGGLPDREFYKHLIFAPGLDTGYAPTTFPGVAEAIDAKDRTIAEEFVGKTTNAIYVAAGILSTCDDWENKS